MRLPRDSHERRVFVELNAPLIIVASFTVGGFMAAVIIRWVFLK